MRGQHVREVRDSGRWPDDDNVQNQERGAKNHDWNASIAAPDKDRQKHWERNIRFERPYREPGNYCEYIIPAQSERRAAKPAQNDRRKLAVWNHCNRKRNSE